uniref:NudC domain containing 3 n=1 Tax=Laticauda laticaudata TaxID=8630 RepID=A0A8C5S5X4_LATLA
MERSGAMTDMYDQALLGILQHVGNVQEFLNVLFGFLYRKTDFYRLLMQPSDRLGFPPGVAKSMVAFKIFEHLAHQDDEKRQQEIEVKLKKKEADMVAAGERPKVPPAVAEVEIATAVEQDSGLESGKTADAEEPVKAEESIEAQIVDTTAELKQEQFQANPDSYNGAVRENYIWSQDYSDLEIKVPVPKHIMKGPNFWCLQCVQVSILASLWRLCCQNLEKTLSFLIKTAMKRPNGFNAATMFP